MKIARLLAGILACLLLFALVSCNKEEEPTPSPNGAFIAGDGEPDGENTNGSADPPSTGEGTDPEADDYMATKGYPYGFTLRFAKGDWGFDTASGFFSGTLTSPYDFSADLAALYQDILERNIYEISRLHADLTYATLSGGQTPPADTVTYTVTFTDNGNTYTVTTDSAALNAYGAATQNSHVSNMKGMIHVLNGYATQRHPLG